MSRDALSGPCEAFAIIDSRRPAILLSVNLPPPMRLRMKFDSVEPWLPPHQGLLHSLKL